VPPVNWMRSQLFWPKKFLVNFPCVPIAIHVEYRKAVVQLVLDVRAKRAEKVSVRRGWVGMSENDDRTNCLMVSTDTSVVGYQLLRPFHLLLQSRLPLAGLVNTTAHDIKSDKQRLFVHKCKVLLAILGTDHLEVMIPFFVKTIESCIPVAPCSVHIRTIIPFIIWRRICD
jgi:hypothetical protein